MFLSVWWCSSLYSPFLLFAVFILSRFAYMNKFTLLWLVLKTSTLCCLSVATTKAKEPNACSPS
jgi:hypothetical protein